MLVLLSKVALACLKRLEVPLTVRLPPTGVVGWVTGSLPVVTAEVPLTDTPETLWTTPF